MAFTKKYKTLLAYFAGFMIPVVLLVTAQLPLPTQSSVSAQVIERQPYNVDLTYQVGKDMVNGVFQELLLQVMRQSGTSFAYSEASFVRNLINENGLPAAATAGSGKTNEYESGSIATAIDKLSFVMAASRAC